MKITTKGQVTIPIDIREQAGLLPNTEVEFVITGKKVYIQKCARTSSRGRKIIEALAGTGDVQMTTDEIMALTRGE